MYVACVWHNCRFFNSMPMIIGKKVLFFIYYSEKTMCTTDPKTYLSMQLFCLPKLYPNRPEMVGCCSIIKIYVYYHIVFKNTILLFTRRMFVENCCFILKRYRSYTSKDHKNLWAFWGGIFDIVSGDVIDFTTKVWSRKLLIYDQIFHWCFTVI